MTAVTRTPPPSGAAAHCAATGRGIRVLPDDRTNRPDRNMKLIRYAKFREEKFGGVLFETRSEKVFALNPTAAALVREIGGGCDEADLIARLKARFSDLDGKLERESREFISSLRNQGLLEE